MATAVKEVHKEPVERSRRRAPKFEQVLPQVEALCTSLRPGDRFPTHLEPMRRFQASERGILRALDELQREGRIVRRQGSGTFVAEAAPIDVAPPIVPSVVTDHRTIVAIRTPDSSFFDRCMDGLFRHVDEAGFALICKIIGPGADLNALVPTDADPSLGYILFRYDLAPLARRIQEQGSRVVIVGAPPVDVSSDVPCIYGDHEHGGYLAMQHLIHLGHTRIAMHKASANTHKTLRWKGYLKAVHEAQRKGRAIEITAISAGEWEGLLSDPNYAVSYFRPSGSPTAVAAWNDSEGAKFLVALNRAGVRVPDEVSVVGYDNMPEGLLVSPALTTVDHAVAWQLSTAVDLLSRPTAPSPTHTAVAMPTLLPRESTAQIS